MPVSVHGTGGMPSPFLVTWAGWLLPGCYPQCEPDCCHVRWTAVHLLDAGYRFPVLLSETYRRGRWPFLFYHATILPYLHPSCTVLDLCVRLRHFPHGQREGSPHGSFP